MTVPDPKTWTRVSEYVDAGITKELSYLVCPVCSAVVHDSYDSPERHRAWHELLSTIIEDLRK